MRPHSSAVAAPRRKGGGRRFFLLPQRRTPRSPPAQPSGAVLRRSPARGGFALFDFALRGKAKRRGVAVGGDGLRPAPRRRCRMKEAAVIIAAVVCLMAAAAAASQQAAEVLCRLLGL